MNFEIQNGGDEYVPVPKKPSLGERALWIARGLLYIAIFFASQFAVSLVVVNVLAFKTVLGNPSLSGSELEALIESTVNSNANFITMISDAIALIISFVIFWIFGKPKSDAENQPQSFKERFLSWFDIRAEKPYIFVIAFFTGLFLNYVTSILMTVLTLVLPESWLGEYAESSASLTQGPLIWYILGTAIIVPLAEEIFFRILPIKRFEKAMPRGAALVLSSLVFGIAHGQIIWIIYATLIGLVFGIIYNKCRSLFVSTFMHIGFNSLNIAVIVLDRKFDLMNTLELIEAGKEVPTANAAAAALYTSLSGYMMLLSLPLSALGIYFLIKLTKKRIKKENTPDI